MYSDASCADLTPPLNASPPSPHTSSSSSTTEENEEVPRTETILEEQDDLVPDLDQVNALKSARGSFSASSNSVFSAVGDRSSTFDKDLLMEPLDFDIVKRRLKPKLEKVKRVKGRKAFTRVMFVWLYPRWWLKRVPPTWLFFSVLVYAMQVSAICVYEYSLERAYASRELEIPERLQISVLQVYMPFILLVGLAIFVSQAAATTPKCLVSGQQSDENALNARPEMNHRREKQRIIKPLPVNGRNRKGSDFSVAESEKVTTDYSSDSDSSSDSGISSGGEYTDQKTPPSSAKREPTGSVGSKKLKRLRSLPSLAKKKDKASRSSRLRLNSETATNVQRILDAALPPSKTGTNPNFSWKSKRAYSERTRNLNSIAQEALLSSKRSKNHELRRQNTSETTAVSDFFVNESTLHKRRQRTKKIKAVVWSSDGRLSKVMMSTEEVSDAIRLKVKAAKPTPFYSRFGMCASVLTGCLPIIYRIMHVRGPLWGVCHSRFGDLVHNFLPFAPSSLASILSRRTEACSSFSFPKYDILSVAIGQTVQERVVCMCTAVSASFLSMLIFRGLCIAENTYWRRFLFAKYFAALTSSRRARKANLPHFRLHKISHIRSWLSLRARRNARVRQGPHRAGDSIAQSSVTLTVCLVGVVGLQIVSTISGGENNGDAPIPASRALGKAADGFEEWVLFLWTAVLCIYMMRFMNLASKTSQKYRNNAQLLTEQLNLYLRMLRKPEKQEELKTCNHVLKIASQLIKELEGDDAKKKRWQKALLNPFVYSLVRVVLLSALGALSSEVLGFRVRLWKL